MLTGNNITGRSTRTTAESEKVPRSDGVSTGSLENVFPMADKCQTPNRIQPSINSVLNSAKTSLTSNFVLYHSAANNRFAKQHPKS
jgi:hypothetical protein